MTNQTKLAFIGHSEGATTMFTALTNDVAEWFKERISVFVAIAPVSRMDHMESFLLITLGKTNFAINLVKALGIHEWFAPNLITKLLFEDICNYITEICEFNFYLISEGDPSANERKSLRTYLGHFPGGLSVKMVDHELQIYNAKQFQYYDYGADENIIHYGRTEPPQIDLLKINGIPIAMMVGKADLLGDVTDALWLKDQLRDNVFFYKEYQYGSTSFYVAKDMNYLEDLTQILDSYKSL